ncbi:hypothetical protein EUGRSUZ_K02108 [Eucalyptus grandis]|uniref:Uncharacterized protein n=2 Tax=Eucalyptus grandis TaxID=71139 RepID=A0ACC3IVZ5_EUCGR|nr:hypothetical protein EUGRSUZ_K02108 [Eucalyptus grandis]
MAPYLSCNQPVEESKPKPQEYPFIRLSRAHKQTAAHGLVEPNRSAHHGGANGGGRRHPGRRMSEGARRRRVRRPTERPDPLVLHVPGLPPRGQREASALEGPPRPVAHRPHDPLQILDSADENPRDSLQQPRVLRRRPRDRELAVEVDVDEVPARAAARGRLWSDHVDELVAPGGEAAGGVPLRLADGRIVPDLPQVRHHVAPQRGLVRPQA